MIEGWEILEGQAHGLPSQKVRRWCHAQACVVPNVPPSSSRMATTIDKVGTICLSSILWVGTGSGRSNRGETAFAPVLYRRPCVPGCYETS